VLGSLLCFFLGEYPGTDLTGIAIDDVKIPTPLPLTTELNGFEFGPGPGRARAARRARRPRREELRALLL